ncbi:lysine--tRNA ligase [Spiroplasma platyhelix]|uniref:Lysine--tRNA ligase n=1 Tax=Spiroplasma platyhelix PALS-1 TaxID=1276218 RepID=A0A846U0N6_9MOLU|nr:lysine--tRNA ligase [Spiroplasma platyhelix]MBE4704211.1 Lysine--tRNA ligase [Spiroplasma platyhelix PALS-1]NKE38584.1 lysine--tRNA ligase [Spiroplasma platyhelix PALS-1]UJB28795.1 lysyl-tRNA synthetase [Spiroplasma platyhelix PALS-1]
MENKNETLVNGRVLKEQEENRYQKLLELEKEHYDVYGRKWERNYNSSTLTKEFSEKIKEQLDELSDKAANDQIKIAGRLMTKRIMGKNSIFANLQDQYGRFQIYLNTSSLDSKEFNLFSEYGDIGDFFGVEGKIMRTKTGELTVKVAKVVMLAKAIKPLPDKWHGIKNIEDRYRHRYLDLVMNQEVKEIFIKRTKIINSLREFLNNQGYLEVETPILQDISGGAAAKPFITFHNALDSNFYLRIATELHLKRLIVGGFEGVYEIGRLFRNEGISPKHNPEFTTVEVYVAYQDMNFLFDLTENCLKYIINKVNNKLTLVEETVNEQGEVTKVELDFAKPWQKIKMLDAIKNVSDQKFSASFAKIYDLIQQYDRNPNQEEVAKQKAEVYQLAVNLAKEYKINVDKHHTGVGHIINLFFEHFVEETLIQPTFIYSYPVEISPLSKLSENSLNFTDRFELFINGKEYANAYSELNNPIQQYQRFEEQVNEKEKGNEEASSEMDLDYVEALEYGMPPTAGLGIGIDRLVMLVTGQHSIKDVLFFPQLKTKKTP